MKKQNQKAQEQKLEKDFQTFLKDDSDDNYKQLRGDVDKLQGSF